jgi:hypothetical protein
LDIGMIDIERIRRQAAFEKAAQGAFGGPRIAKGRQKSPALKAPGG